MARQPGAHKAMYDYAYRRVAEQDAAIPAHHLVVEAAALDAKLVLILANHIGDLDVLNEAIALARKS